MTFPGGTEFNEYFAAIGCQRTETMGMSFRGIFSGGPFGGFEMTSVFLITFFSPVLLVFPHLKKKLCLDLPQS